MQCILGPISTFLENTEPLQLSCLQLDPKPYALQNDLLEYKGHFSGMVSLFTKQNTTIINVLKKTNPMLPSFYVSLSPDPLDFTTFTSMALLLLVLLPSHLDEGLQGEREMQSAHQNVGPSSHEVKETA